MSEYYDIGVVARLRHHVTLESVDFMSLRADAHSMPVAGSALAYDISNCNGVWHQDGDSWLVFLPFEIVATFTPKDGEKQPLATLRVSMRLEYSYRPELSSAGESEGTEIQTGPGPSDDDVCTFLAVSGFMHAWPYLRAEVQSLSTKLGLPALVLPLMVTGHASRYVRLKRLEDVTEEDITDSD